mgnify:CR=1 FL=1|jgi:curved DNA-binding protein CbpA
MDNFKNLNKNPQEKIKYLKSLLQLPNITSQQQSKIYQLIQQTEQQLIQLQKQKQSSNFIGNNRGNSIAPITRGNTVTPITRGNTLVPITRIGTRDFSEKGQQLVTQQQFNDVQSLTKNYQTEEERLEAEFELEQQRKRAQFKESQKRRRLEYQNKLRELEQHNVDALQIFSLSPNYKLSELKHSYKRLAIQTHPDRPNGSKEKFQLITKCYMSLLERLKNRESNKGFMDLRNDSKKYIKTQNDTADKMAGHFAGLYGNRGKEGREQVRKNGGQYLDPRSQSFNTHLFNKLYEDNKLWDPNDDGYEDWFRNGKDKEEKAPDIFSTKFNLSVFNSTFQDIKNKRTGTEIVEYKDPQELIQTSAGYTMVDSSRPIKDFGKATDQAGGLNYSDLKQAYSSGCDLVNPATVQARGEYRTVEDLKRARGEINYIMSPQDMARMEERKRAEAAEEMERIERVRNRDLLFEKQYSNIHQNMLGYKGNPDY